MKKLLLIAFIIPILCKAQSITSIKDSILKVFPNRFVVYQDTSLNQYLQLKYVINTTHSKQQVNDDGTVTAIELWAIVANNKLTYQLSSTKENLLSLQQNSALFNKLKLKQVDPLIWHLQ